MKKSLTLIILCMMSIQSLTAQKEETIIIRSSNLRCNDTVKVYSPSCSGSGTPTLFLLHGWSGCYRNWGDKYDLCSIAEKSGFRIICPDGFYNSWYLNNIDENKMQWRTFFDEELYPQMKEKYGLDPERTFISGLSMGGHGAINIFIDDTTRFRAAGSMSGVLNLHRTNLIENEVSQVLGNYEQNYDMYTSESAIRRIEKIRGCTKPLILCCGYDDSYCICTEEFAARCRELGIPSIEIISPGTHSWKFWGYALGEHLEIYTRILKGENLGY